MIRTYLLTCLSIAAFTAPVAAATEYYVAQDAATKKCSIVTKKPDGKKMMDVGMMMYKTKAECREGNEGVCRLQVVALLPFTRESGPCKPAPVATAAAFER